MYGIASIFILQFSFEMILWSYAVAPSKIIECKVVFIFILADIYIIIKMNAIGWASGDLNFASVLSLSSK